MGFFLYGRGGGVSPVEPTYQNPDPTTIAVGGIPAGSDFFNTAKTFGQKTEAEFYPYQNPSFNSFYLQGIPNMSVGQTLSGTQTFRWTTSNSANINPNTIDITDLTDVLTLFTGLANDGAENYDFWQYNTGQGIRYTSPFVHTWQIKGVNSKGQDFTRLLALPWYWTKYWGNSALTTLTSNDVINLSDNQNSNTGLGNYYFAAGGGYKHICVEVSLPQPTEFIDNATQLPVAMETPVVVAVTNNGVTANYNDYRTTNIINSELTIKAQ